MFINNSYIIDNKITIEYKQIQMYCQVFSLKNNILIKII